MKEIRISNGRVTFVDDEDYRILSRLAWQSCNGRHVSHIYRDGGRTKTILMHHMIVAWMGLKIPPGHEVDHKNRDGFDNQRDNLRVVTQSINGLNKNPPVTNTSGITGVNWDEMRGKWKVRIMVREQSIYLGRFSRFDDAVAARIAAERRYVGHEFTSNQPGPIVNS